MASLRSPERGLPEPATAHRDRLPKSRKTSEVCGHPTTSTPVRPPSGEGRYVRQLHVPIRKTFDVALESEPHPCPCPRSPAGGAGAVCLVQWMRVRSFALPDEQQLADPVFRDRSAASPQDDEHCDSPGGAANGLCRCRVRRDPHGRRDSLATTILATKFPVSGDSPDDPRPAAVEAQPGPADQSRSRGTAAVVAFGTDRQRSRSPAELGTEGDSRSSAAGFAAFSPVSANVSPLAPV